MKLYDFLLATGADYDTEDNVWCGTITVCAMDENEEDMTDFYNCACIELYKKVEVVGQPYGPYKCWLPCAWTEFIMRNIKEIRQWCEDTLVNCNPEWDDDRVCEFLICDKIIHLILGGYMAESEYEGLYQMLKRCK